MHTTEVVKPQAANPALRTSVHPKETSGPVLPNGTYGDALRSRFPIEYPATEKAYSCWDAFDHTERAESLRVCRDWAWFAREDATGSIRVLSSACHLRWCPICAHARSSYTTYQIIPWLQSLTRPKLLTLTLKHSNAPLQHQITHLYKFYSSLKKKPIWKKAVQGGVWFFQVKKSTDGTQWHPHLHILLDSEFMPHNELCAVWQRITGSSSIVDIRVVWNIRNAVKYVARYATRPCTLSSLDLSDAVTVMQALHGRRIAGSWGSASVVKLSYPKIAENQAYTSLGKWEQVLEESSSNPAAAQILAAWRTGESLPASVFLHDPHQDIPGDIPLLTETSLPYVAASLWDP